jgi:hypothetical protein
MSNMVELRWTGPGLSSRGSNGFLEPGATVDVDEDEVDDYLDNRSGGWERVDSDSDTEDEADAENQSESESESEADADPDHETDTGVAEEPDPESGDIELGYDVDEEPPISPSEYTIVDLEDELTREDYSDEELEALLEAEKENKDRNGAVDAIIAALEG